MERFEICDEFTEMEDMMEDLQQEMIDEYSDMVHEEEMNDFIESALENQIENHPQFSKLLHLEVASSASCPMGLCRRLYHSRKSECDVPHRC